MPVQEDVVGFHLDLAGVAADERVAAQAKFVTLVSNDSDLSASDRMELITDLAAIAGVQLALACVGEDQDRYLIIANVGFIRVLALAWSRSPDAIDPPAAPMAPVLAVSGDIDVAIQRLERAAAEPIYDHGDGTIRMPLHWRSREELVRAMLDLAPQLGQPAFLAQIDERRYEITFARGRLRCEPLYLVAPDAGPGFGTAFFELARVTPPSPADRVELLVPTRATETIASAPMRDPSRPFTTGTVAQRRQSIAAATAGRTHDFPRLIAALRDPANADPRFDQVRRDLYRYLSAHDTRENAGVFLWALQEESDTVIDTVTYFAWRQTALRKALPELADAADARGDDKLARRMRAALGEADAG